MVHILFAVNDVFPKDLEYMLLRNREDCPQMISYEIEKDQGCLELYGFRIKQPAFFFRIDPGNTSERLIHAVYKKTFWH